MLVLVSAYRQARFSREGFVPPKGSTVDPRWGREPRRCREGHHRPVGAAMPRNKDTEPLRRDAQTENILPRTVQIRSMSLDRSKRLRSRDDSEEEAPPACKFKMQKDKSPEPPASTSSLEQSSSQQEDTILPAQDPLPTPATPSPLAAAQAISSQEMEPASSLEDGFTLVTSKKKSQKTTTNKTPSTMRPWTRVSLAPRPPPTNQSLAFKIKASTCFPNPYEALMLLHKDPSLSFTARPGRDSTFIVYPSDEATATKLRATKTLENREVDIETLDPATKTTKGVLMGFSQSLPVEIIEGMDKVLSASRCTFNGHGTRQVLVEMEGPLPGHLDLGIWGVFYLRPYTPEPKRCYKCQAFGHSNTQCRNLPRCGICSAQHDTNQCLQRYKAKEEVTHKCPNCGGSHHAWNKACPERRRRVQEGIAAQTQWVKTYSNAPPGTFV